jgi:uncharacterized RDD family membrane protein YckC
MLRHNARVLLGLNHRTKALPSGIRFHRPDMQDENPYQSPAETGLIEPAAPTDVLPASAGRRFANLILDQIVCLFLAFAIAFVQVVLAVTLRTENVLTKIPDILICIVVCLVYYVPQEALFGKTLGKLLTGTKTVSVTGARPTFGQIVGRTFCRLIPFEPFSFLFGGGNPVGWHDKFSNTRVVKVR